MNLSEYLLLSLSFLFVLSAVGHTFKDFVTDTLLKVDYGRPKSTVFTYSVYWYLRESISSNMFWLFQGALFAFSKGYRKKVAYSEYEFEMEMEKVLIREGLLPPTKETDTGN